MNREESIKKLEMLKALPVCTVTDVFQDVSMFSENEIHTLNEYLKKFIKPSSLGGKCAMCDSSLYITWGLAHGIGYCGDCGTSIVVYHYYKDIGINKDGRFEKSLQYHGNCYSIDNE